jgi:hypothetical protein
MFALAVQSVAATTLNLFTTLQQPPTQMLAQVRWILLVFNCFKLYEIPNGIIFMRFVLDVQKRTILSYLNGVTRHHFIEPCLPLFAWFQCPCTLTGVTPHHFIDAEFPYIFPVLGFRCI